MPGDTKGRIRRLKREAIQGALLSAALHLAAAAVLVWSAALTEGVPLLQAVLALLALAMGSPALLVWPALRQRLKEIEGGEYDAAAQY